MELLKPLFADGLLKAPALVSAAKSKEAFKREDCILVGYKCALTNDIVRLVYVVVKENG